MKAMEKIVTRVRLKEDAAQEFDAKTEKTVDEKRDQCAMRFVPGEGVEVMTKKKTWFLIPLSSIKTVYYRSPVAGTIDPKATKADKTAPLVS